MIGNVGMGNMPPMMPPMRNHGAHAAEDMISKADTDSNGVVSKEELGSFLQSFSGSGDSDAINQDSLENMFADFDADSDGSITRDEASNALSNLLESMRGEVNGMRPLSPPPHGQGPLDPQAFFADADADGNGSIDETEFTTMLENGPLGAAEDSSSISTLFEEADADGDGGISQEELQSAMESHHHRHRPDAGSDDALNQQQANNSNPLNQLVSQLLKYYQSVDATTSSALSETA